jgi:hypothetical protein
MLYAGLMHSNAYYGYFRMGSFPFGLASFDLAVRSLRLVTFPVLITLAVAAVAPRFPDLLVRWGAPRTMIDHLRRAGRAIAGAYLLFIAAGLALIPLWPHIGSHKWAAPLLVAGGLVLSQSRSAAPPRGIRPWERAVALVTAGLFLMWAVALISGQLGRQDAQADAQQIIRRVAVVVLSSEPLSLNGPGIAHEDLGAAWHYRHRYSGLRLLAERDHHYYLLPLGWNHDTGATYDIEDNDSIRIELYPGTQPSR